MSSDSDEENVIFGLQLEPDPESISVYWEKNLKSHEYGVFYSHNKHYKWYRQKVTENSDRIRMDCSFKKSLGCKARAHVDVIHQEPLEDGTVPPPVLKLVLIHTPDSHNHAPDSCRFLAQSIMQKMKLEIQEFPCNKIKPMVDRVLLRELAPYENNKPLRDEILNSLPKNKVTTLSAFRKNITGGLPGILHQFILADIIYLFLSVDREGFDPGRVLSSVQYGQDVICLDSQVDLPPRWWTIPLTEFIPLGHPGHDIPGLDVTIQDGDGRPDDWLPERVIIYTTHELLALLSCCRKAGADGTFNVRNNYFFEICPYSLLFRLLVNTGLSFTSCSLSIRRSVFSWQWGGCPIRRHFHIMSSSSSFYLSIASASLTKP